MGDVLRRMTLRSLRLNRKRTAVTVIGIILATALITAVANVAESFRASMMDYQRLLNGNFHYRFWNVEPEERKYFVNNRNIESIHYCMEQGYALLEESGNPRRPYLYVCAMNEGCEDALSLQLAEGRFPEKEGELLLSDRARTEGGLKVSVGEQLTLKLGYRERNGKRLSQRDTFLENGEESAEVFRKEKEVTYTVVGILKEDTNGKPGYEAFTYLDGNALPDSPVDLYVRYTKKALQKDPQTTCDLLGISLTDYQKIHHAYEEILLYGDVPGGIYFTQNSDLIRLELSRFSYNTLSALYSMAGLAIAIIIVSAVFCIHNSFTISLTEKMRLYGMLSSVGATKKQMRGMVYWEAAVLAALGIPLGILSGVLATLILVRFAGGMLRPLLGMELTFVVSVPAMVLGALLSVVTVFLSAGQSARKAGKIAPIAAIRGNETITLSRWERRAHQKEKSTGRSKPIMTKLVNCIFGIGGLIAYKNLRRARVKYRTTVIAIVIGVATFIAMGTFVGLAFVLETENMEKVEYQFDLTLSSWSWKYEDSLYQKALEIASLDGMTKVEVSRISEYFVIPAEEVSYTEKYRKDHPNLDSREKQYFSFVSLGDQAYEEYCKGLGLSPARAADQGILVADYSEEMGRNGKIVTLKGMILDYRPGDVLRLTGSESDEEIEITVARLTDQRPWRLQNYSGTFLVVSDSWMDRHSEILYPQVRVKCQCADTDQMEKAIQQCLEGASVDFYLSNYEKEYRETRGFFLAVSVFLYGFIAVIALIGVTNIFNTITTNMELRSREFAMLRSVGMTGREFRGMIRLENLFYGCKSLVWGILLGCLLSYGFYRGIAPRIEMPYEIPWKGIGISVLAVFALLYGIMRYSMGKIRRKDIIETIQNENL